MQQNIFRQFLDEYPITARQCFELAKVNRTTFQRWLSGESTPPAATLELFKLHAAADPSTLALNWHGWTFNNGKLWTPSNRGFESYQIEELPNLYRDRAILKTIRQDYALQSKLF